MTRFLFVDNFRGFTNTYIPLADVNFFVGENSSGKTSILSLLKLLSTNQFSWQLKFSTGDVNFGHFRDMVSAHSKDRNYFSFGVIDEYQRDNRREVTAMLYTFVEHDEGLARLSKFAAIVGQRQIFLRFDGNKAYFKAQALHSDLTVNSFRNTIMPYWAEERSSDLSGYRPVIESPGYPGQERPLFVPLMQAATLAHAPGEVGVADHPALHFGGQELVWIAPIRTKPQRTYDDPSQSDFSPEGQHTPYLIRRVSQPGTDTQKAFESFMGRAGKSSGLFESIEIKRYGDQNDVTAPFEVDAVLDGTPLSLINLGYGVSQSLPVFVEIVTRPPGSCFAIQQPEVHLHPRAQAALGDAFFDMAVRHNKRFMIETHSDFTIDRFRMNYRKRGRKPSSQILFFERRNKRNTVSPLVISPAGELPADQPESYRKFFVKEQLELLGL